MRAVEIGRRSRARYRETAIYRAALTGSGSSLTIGVPGKAGDLKYYYTQNMALHYLMMGDDRFRESAEQLAQAHERAMEPNVRAEHGVRRTGALDGRVLSSGLAIRRAARPAG